MDVSQSLQDASHDMRAFRKAENSTLFLPLSWVDVSAFTVLHDNKDPSLIFISYHKPSKVRVNLTILLWSGSLMLWISCSMYLTKYGFFENWRLLMHFTEYTSFSADLSSIFSTEKTKEKAPLPKRRRGWRLFRFRIYRHCLAACSSCIKYWNYNEIVSLPFSLARLFSVFQHYKHCH